MASLIPNFRAIPEIKVFQVEIFKQDEIILSMSRFSLDLANSCWESRCLMAYFSVINLGYTENFIYLFSRIDSFTSMFVRIFVFV